MSARRFVEDHMAGEGLRMNIDLTPREVELMLLIMNDAAVGDFGLDGSPIYTTEEFELTKIFISFIITSKFPISSESIVLHL